MRRLSRLMRTLGGRARRRRQKTGALIGPYYPAVSAGLMTLSDTDTGNRFKIAGGVWTIDDADGTHVAYLPTENYGGQNRGRFVLVAE